MQTILAIHTATPTLGLGLFTWPDGRELRSQLWPLDRQMGNQLHQCLAELVTPTDWPNLGAVAAIVGPGSFTSCRMGVTLARTLGQSLDIPVFGISALAAIAAAHLSHQNHSPARAIVYLDAKRNEYFAGVYQWKDGNLTTIERDRLYSQEEWSQACQDSIAIDASTWTDALPLASLVQLASHRWHNGEQPDWQELLPFYGRKPPIHNG